MLFTAELLRPRLTGALCVPLSHAQISSKILRAPAIRVRAIAAGRLLLTPSDKQASGFHLLTGSKFRRLLCMTDTVVLFNQWFICPGRIHRNLKWSGGKMLKPSFILLMGVFSVGHRGYILSICSTFVFFVVQWKGVWIHSSLHNSSYDKRKYVNLCCCVYLNCTRILATFSSKFLLIFMECVQLGFFFSFNFHTFTSHLSL